MKNHICCFTGPGSLPPDKIERIIKRLNAEVENLMCRGVTRFISGGARGFDLIAASLVIAKRELGRDVRLIFALPCRNQEKHWPNEQAALYKKLLLEADEIRCISQECSDGCVKERNRYMVDESAFCVCYLVQNGGGTFKTVNYALKKGVQVINVACKVFDVLQNKSLPCQREGDRASGGGIQKMSHK